MDPTIFGRVKLIWEWYNWGVFVAFAVAIMAAFWIFYDSQQKGTEPILWKVVTVVATILLIPSLFLRISPSMALSMLTAVEPLGYLGILAGVAALFAIIAYAAGIGVEPGIICPNCGRRLDPSWDRCPYCAPQMPATVPAPPVPPLEPTARVAPPPSTVPPPMPKPAETELLRKEPPQIAFLVIQSGARAGKEFRLGETTTIGRDAAQCDVVVDDTAISRQHARIKLEHGQFVLYDLASANGTFVNNQQIQKQALADKDVIKMGNTAFVFMEVKSK